uniref:Vacuolar protein sorting-associated protein 35B n=1 Tax=Lygus hesperus TaxID=30085 RepID=A0A0A9WMW9_LYGHE
MEARRSNYFSQSAFQDSNHNGDTDSRYATDIQNKNATMAAQQAVTTTAAAVNNSINNNTLPLTAARKMHKERNELKVLVGINIVRISQLDGVDVQMYKTFILPNLLSVIVKHR